MMDNVMQQLETIDDQDFLNELQLLREQGELKRIVELLQEHAKDRDEYWQNMSSNIPWERLWDFDGEALENNDIERFWKSIKFTCKMRMNIRNLMDDNSDNAINDLEIAYKKDFLFLLINRILNELMFKSVNNKEKDVMIREVLYPDEKELIERFCEFFDCRDNEGIFRSAVKEHDIFKDAMPVYLYWYYCFEQRYSKFPEYDNGFPIQMKYLLEVKNLNKNLLHNAFIRFIVQNKTVLEASSLNMYLFNLYSPISDIQFWYNQVKCTRKKNMEYIDFTELHYDKNVLNAYYSNSLLTARENTLLLTPTIFKHKFILVCKSLTEREVHDLDCVLLNFVEEIFMKIHNNRLEMWLADLGVLTEEQCAYEGEIVMEERTDILDKKDYKLLEYVNQLVVRKKNQARKFLEKNLVEF